MTTFFPITVRQRAITKLSATTLHVIAASRGWSVGVKFFTLFTCLILVSPDSQGSRVLLP